MVNKKSDIKRQRVKTESPPSSTQPRSIDACRRCRMKKVKCDQNFPTCLRCRKAGAECVGIDRATGKSIPRSYVYHLERKISALEDLLKARGIGTREVMSAQSPTEMSHDSSTFSNNLETESAEDVKVEPPLNHANGGGSPTYMGASSGITFARLITAAVKMKKESTHISVDQSTNPPAVNHQSAVLPAKNVAQVFVRTYFAHSNSQLPILHREMFLTDFFEPIYGSWDDTLSSSSEPFSKIKSSSIIPPEDTWLFKYKKIISKNLEDPLGSTNSILRLSPCDVPQKYHRPLFYLNIIFAIASSVNHLQYMNSLSEQFRTACLEYASFAHTSIDLLERLQSELLLSLFSLMRPCRPGVWHRLGNCLRICVELGLHNNAYDKNDDLDAFTKDRRRRLFWCTYSLDRQICFYMGRPVGIPEGSVKTIFPSGLDDAYILKNSPGIKDYSVDLDDIPNYKSVSLAFFSIRKIQSEVQRVLYECEELPRQFDTLEQWKHHVETQLDDWWVRACELERCREIEFHIEFFSLNYNHTLLSLNGLSPRNLKLSQHALIKVAETSKNLMLCYTQLYHKKAINYTWAAVHNLSMAGTSFLYALYHSEEARTQFPKDVVMKVSENCITVLTSLIASCDAAKDCSSMFRILTAAILKIRYNEIVDGSTRIITDQSLGYDNLSETPGTRPEFGIVKSEAADQPCHDGLVRQEADPSADAPVSTYEYAFNWVPHIEGAEVPGNAHQVEQSNDFLFQESNFESFLPEISSQSPMTSLPDSSSGVFTECPTGMGHSSSEFYPLVRDGRKAFDLIQLPTELIWGQFFTDPISYPDMQGGFDDAEDV